MVAADRVVKVLEEPSETDDVSVCQDLTKISEGASIHFDSVSFKYPNRDFWALRNVTFNIEAGQSVAIVGATGSGKSTLIRLLMRFYSPTEGAIFFGGKPLTQYERKIIRKHIGVIQQEVFLFRGTLRDNLTLGREGWTDQYLEEQCRKTHLWDLIAKRGGLELLVTEGGSNLSLGERQLLAFTRMWVFQPELLVLDEATASIDPVSERYLMSAVEDGLRGRTSIVIAHRLSTIRKCDKIIVLENGAIAEMGSYEALLKKRGLFYEFHEIYTHPTIRV